MIRRAVWGAWVCSLLGCAAARPPPAASAVNAAAPLADARAPAERPRPVRAPDPPGTRRVGVGEWSLAIGEDWEHRDHNGSQQYVLPLGDAGVVIAGVGRDPRPRGPAAVAFPEVIAELREQYERAGVRVVATRDVTVDGAPGVDVMVASQYAGRRVAVLTRAQVEGDVTTEVWCTAPVERVAAVRAECGRIRATLRGGEPVAAATGTRVVRRGDASVSVPEAWIDPPRRTDGSAVARSEAGPDSITVELEAGELEGTASEFLSGFVEQHRESGATILSDRRGRAARRRWVDNEITLAFPETGRMVQRLVLHGDDMFSVTCAEPGTEVTAGRARCAAVLDSFRFGSP